MLETEAWNVVAERLRLSFSFIQNNSIRELSRICVQHLATALRIVSYATYVAAMVFFVKFGFSTWEHLHWRFFSEKRWKRMFFLVQENKSEDAFSCRTSY